MARRLYRFAADPCVVGVGFWIEGCVVHPSQDWPPVPQRCLKFATSQEDSAWGIVVGKLSVVGLRLSLRVCGAGILNDVGAYLLGGNGNCTS